MSVQLRPDDARLAWQGAISMQHADGWVMPWRIPYEDRALFPPLALQEKAAMSAGVRIAFRSDTSTLAGRIEPETEISPLDLMCDGRLHGSVALANRDGFRFENLPPGEKLLELWLPQIGRFRLRSIEIDDGASVAPFEDGRPRWTTYGSSITHCASAESPSQTWPAIVARQHGLDLTCLGYGGNCHLEPMIARMMRDLPADFLSMKIGINIFGNASLSARTFRAAVIGFVEIVREKHAETPFAVVSPIVSPPREDTPNEVGLTLVAMRDEVEEAVGALRARGDRNLHYVDGLRILGPDQAHLLPDGTHPSAEGYRVMGRRFLDQVARPIFVGG